jgi:shikimate kinase
MNLRLKRTPGIYVVGFMASGKSTIGRHLAHRLGWSFFDTDDEIVAAEKCAIADIFAGRGEAEFRRIETEILRQHVRWIERGRPAVLALGGGAFTIEANRALVADNGISLWLDCPFDRVQQRLTRPDEAPVRPLARDPETFAKLFETRRAHYALADIQIPVDTDDVERTVEQILIHPALR